MNMVNKINNNLIAVLLLISIAVSLTGTYLILQRTVSEPAEASITEIPVRGEVSVYVPPEPFSNEATVELIVTHESKEGTI